MISTALRHVQNDKSVLVIMDDRRGRAFVKQLNSSSIEVVGTAAIVAIAKEKGLIDSAAEVFEQLIRNGLYTSRALVETLLRRVGETSRLEIVNTKGIAKKSSRSPAKH